MLRVTAGCLKVFIICTTKVTLSKSKRDKQKPHEELLCLHRFMF